ncbi:MAG: hypothetical protein HY257_01750 [Chloroflexi bacterium]|nr:hypothetical protein [Chloroflexota bacterium]
MLLNSILYRANDALRQLAAMLGEPTEEIEQWMQAGHKAFKEKLWNENDALYYDYDVRNARVIRENTIAAFMPLYAGVAEDEPARRLVQNHLLDSAQYAPDLDNTKFRIPTASKSNRYFDPRGYWRGPIWVNLNWFLIQGLTRYGYHDLARQIREDTLALVESAGFHEYFDPRTGVGYGTDKFSWSAAFVIDLVEDGD